MSVLRRRNANHSSIEDQWVVVHRDGVLCYAGKHNGEVSSTGEMHTYKTERGARTKVTSLGLQWPEESAP